MSKKMGILIWMLSLGYKSVRIKEPNGNTRLLTGWGKGGIFGQFIVILVWWIVYTYFCDGLVFLLDML